VDLAAAPLRRSLVVDLVRQEVTDGRQQKRPEPAEFVPGVPEVPLLEEARKERLREVLRLIG